MPRVITDTTGADGAKRGQVSIGQSVESGTLLSHTRGATHPKSGLPTPQFYRAIAPSLTHVIPPASVPFPPPPLHRHSHANHLCFSRSPLSRSLASLPYPLRPVCSPELSNRAGAAFPAGRARGLLPGRPGKAGGWRCKISLPACWNFISGGSR